MVYYMYASLKRSIAQIILREEEYIYKGEDQWTNLNAPFLHDLCKVDNCVVSVYKDFVSAEVAGTTV